MPEIISISYEGPYLIKSTAPPSSSKTYILDSRLFDLKGENGRESNTDEAILPKRKGSKTFVKV